MKIILTALVIMLLCNNRITIAQTNANIPSSENVLVVYKVPVGDDSENDSISLKVMRHYQSVREIPPINILGLQGLTNEWFTYGGTSHRIEIVQSGDVLKDTTQAWADRPDYVAGPSFHVWQYYYERIATPILQRLGAILPNGDTLKNKIRYIVLCKGVPYKLQSRFDYSGASPEYPPNHNVSLQSLVSIISNLNYYNLLLSLYGGAKTYNNRYYACDENFTMDYRFIPNFFTNANGVTLSYLVSRLDGLSLDDVKSMIDKAKISDMTGTRTWVLDSYLYTPPQGWPVLLPRPALSEKLRMLQFEVNDDFTSDSIWNNNLYNNNLVMGYSSMGKHAGMSPGYIQNSLNFQYAPGAILNTFESFNGNSFGEIKQRDGHGLLAEFIRMGGTGGVCYPWEPGYSNNIVYGEYFFPAYALGYNLVDAIYMDMPNILFQNVVVGDPLTRIFPVQVTKILTQDSTITSGDIYSKIIVPEGITLTIPQYATVNFRRNSSLQVNGILNIEDGAILNFYGYSNLKFDIANVEIADGTFNFYNNSYLTAANLSIGAGEHLQFNNKSSLSTDSLTLAAGAVLSLNDESQLLIKHKLYAVGTELEKIIFNSNDSTSSITVSDANSVELSNAIVNGATLRAIVKTFYDAKINVNKVEFNNSINIYGPQSQTQNCELNIENVSINGAATEGLHIMDVMDVNLENIIVSGESNSSAGIWIDNCSNVSISTCNISNFTNGILYGLDLNHYLDSMLFITNNIINDCFTGVYVYCFTGELLQISNNNMNGLVHSENNDTKGVLIGQSKAANISDCIISYFDYGISYKRDSGTDENPLLSGNLVIENNQINNCIEGIYFNDFQTIFPIIKKNIITSPKLVSENEKTSAIILMSGSEAAIESNTIYDYDFGIQLSQVAYPYIADNKIQILNNRGTAESGIFSNSDKGIYRLNLITGYKKGIELGNSFPLLGQNIITQNTETGLYVSANSFPDLSRGRVKMEAAVREFPLSGLNQIYNNGSLCSYDPFDGSEIYIEGASINLSNGCNTISDDRSQEPNLCNTRILLTALAKGYEDIRAEYNYWGYQPEYGGHNPSERIRSNVQIFFEPFNTEPCVKYADDKFIVIKNSSGDAVIDTIFSLGEVTSSDSISETYALASKYFYDGHFTEAKQVYCGIIQTHGLNRKSIEAYTKLYTISKLTDTLTTTFAELKIFYDNKLQSIQDTLMFKIVKHLSDLCLVAKKDYAQSINNFSDIIVQNPNSEEAFFASIDILTTSLLDTGNTSLGKVAGIDLSVKDANDYRTKLNALIRARNNKQHLFTSKVIPTEYTLYQNYPNPFNPLTKIQYDIPADTKVQLKIYDILGREVKTLVNEFQNAGRYNVEFNANNLTSGIYIYQLSAKGFIKSRKMMLIK